MVTSLENLGVEVLQFRLDGNRPDLTKLDTLLGLLSSESSFFSRIVNKRATVVEKEGIEKVIEQLKNPPKSNTTSITSPSTKNVNKLEEEEGDEDDEDETGKEKGKEKEEKKQLSESGEVSSMALARQQYQKIKEENKKQESEISKLKQDVEMLKSLIQQPEDMPEDFFCPITQEVFVDPVICGDGHSYERRLAKISPASLNSSFRFFFLFFNVLLLSSRLSSNCTTFFTKRAIEAWFKNHSTSPLTGVKLPSKMLIPNHTLRKAIEEKLNKK